MTLSPTKNEIGTYAVRISYSSPVNSGTVNATFIVDVYPNFDYSFPQPATTCNSDIYPLTIGNQANIQILDSDYDGSNIIVCGGTSSTNNAWDTSYTSAFL